MSVDLKRGETLPIHINMTFPSLPCVVLSVDAIDLSGKYEVDLDTNIWKLDDTILQTIETAPNPELKESRDLVLRIQRRELYQDYESKEKFHISDDYISRPLPACYQDSIVRVYAKKPELVEAVSKAFDNFQLKMYGVKARVHETPEKKKRR